MEDPGWAEDFAPNGTRVGEGDTMTRKRYARVLEAIATQGSDAIYKGPLAEAMVRALRKSNGTMTIEDLKNYDINSRTPVEIGYRGMRIYGCGVPSSGAVVLSILKILEAYTDFGSGEHIDTHRMDEAIRFGYGKRASFGDPSFVPGMHAFEAFTLSSAFACTTKAKISDSHTLNISDYDPSGFEIRDNYGTSQVTVADASGMAASLTTTVNLFFGSGVMVPEMGVVMNDEMTDFSIPGVPNVFGYYPSPSNYIAPGKRPMSSIAPIMVEFGNGTLYAVLGASGGSRIITTVIQNALNILDYGMSVHDAIKRPRFHDQLLPNLVTFEYGFDNATTAFMSSRGHNVTWGTVGSSAQGIRFVDGEFEAAGEPRQHDSAGLTV